MKPITISVVLNIFYMVSKLISPWKLETAHLMSSVSGNQDLCHHILGFYLKHGARKLEEIHSALCNLLCWSHSDDHDHGIHPLLQNLHDDVLQIRELVCCHGMLFALNLKKLYSDLSQILVTIHRRYSQVALPQFRRSSALWACQCWLPR